MNIFAHKLKIAIFDNTNNSSNKDKIFDLLKKMFGGKVLIEFYSDTKEMFVALNIAKAKNKPFDATILGGTEEMETKIVLQRMNPSMDVISYVDDDTFKYETMPLSSKYFR
jgi:hypothetical protein